MPRAVKVKRGAGYLPEYDIGDPERMLRLMPHGKPRLRVHAAIPRKRGMSGGATGKALKESPSTIHDWLERLASGGPVPHM